MMTKIKALIWEECRVGGTVALFCSLTVAFVMFACKVQMNYFFNRALSDELLVLMTVFGAPVFIAFLMTMNPNQKGDLEGGFPDRIMQLPIPTIAPVTIAFIMRSMFVVGAAFFIIVASNAIHEYEFRLSVAFSVLFLFFTMQVLDWLRVPFPVLNKVILLSMGVLFVTFSIGGQLDEFVTFFAVELPTIDGNKRATLFVVLMLYGCVTYGVALAAVGAARVGRRVGFPHFLTSNKRTVKSARLKQRPFLSPLRAHIWLNLRQAGWVFPSVTLVTSVFLYVWFQILFEGSGSRSRTEEQLLLSITPFLALAFGALVHGGNSIITKARRTKGMSGYTYLQPCTSSHMATAKVIADFVHFFLLISIVMILHFTMPGTDFFTRFVPEAFAAGVTSTREILWIVLGRSFVFGLAAWVLLALSSRLLFFLLGCMGVFPLLMATEFRFDFSPIGIDEGDVFLIFLTVIVVIPICFTAIGYRRAWKRGIISNSALLFWMTAWMLVGGLLHSRTWGTTWLLTDEPLWYLAMIGVSISSGSLVTVPYLVTVLDVHKKRHSAMPRQNRNTRWKPESRKERSLAIVVLILVLGGIWLALPIRPAYLQNWKEAGLPTSMQEIIDRVPAVDEEKNLAPQYLAVYQRNLDNMEIHDRKVSIELGRLPKDHYNHLPMVGQAILLRSWNPLSSDQREAILRYWEEVTQFTAPELIRLNGSENGCRFRMVLIEDETYIESDHLTKIRWLGQELAMDAYYWAIQGDTGQSTESLLAIFDLADRLKNDPLLSSQSIRIAMYGYVSTTLQDVLSITSWPREELLKIQHVLNQKRDALDDLSLLKTGMVQSGLTTILNSERYPTFGGGGSVQSFAFTPLTRTVLSLQGEHLIFGMLYRTILDVEKTTWNEHQLLKQEIEDWDQYSSIAPETSSVAADLLRYFERVYRMQSRFDLAITGISAELFRMDRGRYPKPLNELLPQYLDSIPMDFFSRSGLKTLEQSSSDNAFFSSYSVMLSRATDFESTKNNGDISFNLITRKKLDLGIH